jgi:hypothetical protein
MGMLISRSSIERLRQVPSAQRVPGASAGERTVAAFENDRNGLKAYNGADLDFSAANDEEQKRESSCNGLTSR